MVSTSSDRPDPWSGSPKDVRHRLDDVDRTLLRLLAADARTSNKELAERAGIAASTCLARVRALRESGVIRGFHADIDAGALGLDLEAMIAIRLRPDARATMHDVIATLARRPEVLDVYFVAGEDDFLLHVATAGTAELRRFVADHLNRDERVAGTQTSLIFEHVRAAGRFG